MKCNRVREIIFLVVDGEAGQEILGSVERHLVQCPGCARELEHARRFVAVLRERCSRTCGFWSTR